jgi:TetR/AcrR family transcriptional regulator, mexJK operon transcriptional repressor
MTQTREHVKPGLGGRKSKRDRVVGAAARLFLDAGYGTTGMDAIASEAGVSKATVYSYYGDKATLFADVISRMCEQMGGDHELEALAKPSPSATLSAAATFYLQRVLESLDRGLLQRVVAETKEFPELGKKFWAQGPAKMEEFVADYLADAHRRGVLHVKDPVRAAERFIGIVAGVYLLPRLVGVRSRPSERELRRELDEVVTGFLATLRAKSTSEP